MASRRSTAPAAAPRRTHLRVVRGDERPSRRQRSANRRSLRKARRLARDPMPRTVALLLVSAFLLTGIGLVMVLSASSVTSFQASGDSFLYLKRQAIYAAIGVVALFVTFRISYRRWEKWAVPLLLVSAALLALALHPSIGSTAGGSSRWIQMGPVTIQPSEMTKLAIVVFAATILTRKWRRLDEPMHLAIPLAPAALVVCGLIILQRDLGTTAIVALTTMVLVFAAGVRMRYLVLTGLAALGAGWFLIMGEAYRRDRFLSFLHPWADRSNTGYQLIQSLLGLGSGGMFGVGVGASRAKWSYIPNAHTDFIFSILGEEIGLLGELVVLGLFVALIYSGFRIASRVNDTFGRLLATGIVRVARAADAHQPRGRHRDAAGDGGAAAVRVVRRVVPDRHARRRRHSGERRPDRRGRAGMGLRRGRTRRTPRRPAGSAAEAPPRGAAGEAAPASGQARAASRRSGPQPARRSVEGPPTIDGTGRERGAEGDPAGGPAHRGRRGARARSAGDADALDAAATRWRHPAGKGATQRPAVHRAEPPGRSSGSRRHGRFSRSSRSSRRTARAPASSHPGGTAR